MAHTGLPAAIAEPVILTIGGDDRHLQLAFVLDLSRKLSPVAVRAAVLGSVTSFPVLRSRYVPGFWRDRWVPSPEFPIERAVTEEPAPADLAAATTRLAVAPIDPLSGWPFRVHLVPTEGGTRLVIPILHLVADGNGLLTLVADLVARLAGESRPPFAPMDRGFGQLLRALRPAAIPVLLGELAREAIRPLYIPLIGRWIARFAGLGRGPYHPHIVTVVTTPPAEAALLDRCKRAGATVNDGLVTLATLIAGRRSSGAWTGAAYTINLRRFLDDPGPIIANLSGVNLVHVRRRDDATFDTLLPVVARQAGEQKRRLPGLAFSLLPAIFLGWAPHGILRALAPLTRLIFRLPMIRMGVITNVGVVDPYVRALGDEVRDAWMLAPFGGRFPAPIVMASTFRGRITLTVAADGTPGVDDLAAQWAQAVEALVEPA